MEAFLREYMDPDGLGWQYSCRSRALAGRGCGTLHGELISPFNLELPDLNGTQD